MVQYSSSLRFVSFQFCFLVGLVLLVSSCTTKPAFVSPYVAVPSGDLVNSFSDFQEIVAARSTDRPLFWARTGVKLTESYPRRQKNKFDATLIYGKPNKMRVRGTHFLLGTMFELILDGDKAFVFINEQQTLFEGSLKEMQENGGVLGSFTPEDLIGAVRVYHRLAELMQNSATEGKWSTTDTTDFLFVIYSQPSRTFVWKVRKNDGLIQELLVSNPSENNRLELQILYWKYEQPSNEEPYPTRLEIQLTDQKVTLDLDVNEIKLQPELNPAVITMLPRSIKNRLPMSALAEQTPVLPEE